MTTRLWRHAVERQFGGHCTLGTQRQIRFQEGLKESEGSAHHNLDFERPCHVGECRCRPLLSAGWHGQRPQLLGNLQHEFWQHVGSGTTIALLPRSSKGPYTKSFPKAPTLQCLFLERFEKPVFTRSFVSNSC